MTAVCRRCVWGSEAWKRLCPRRPGGRRAGARILARGLRDLDSCPHSAAFLLRDLGESLTFSGSHQAPSSLTSCALGPSQTNHIVNKTKQEDGELKSEVQVLGEHRGKGGAYGLAVSERSWGLIRLYRSSEAESLERTFQSLDGGPPEESPQASLGTSPRQRASLP